METKNIILFNDLVGRTIMGNLLQETDTQLKIENPTIVHIQPVRDGQVQVQVIPFVIPEFVTESKRKEPLIWYFSKTSVTYPESIEVASTLTTQYNRIFSPIITPADAPVIDLFK